MIEIDIVKIVIDVLINLPLLMALLLVVNEKINGKQDIEFKIREWEELNHENDYVVRLIEKFNEVVHKNE